MQLISDSTPIARKEYHCDASGIVREYIQEGIFSIAEYRQIVKAKRQGYRILPGQQYVKQEAAESGTIRVWRAIPDMHDLCIKYDLYDYE